MKTLRHLTFLSAISLVLWSTAFGQCDNLLRDGVFDKLDTNENSYSSMVWAYRLSQMTASEARSAMKGKASIPIKGIPVNGEFSDDRFNSWKQSVNTSMDFSSITSNQRSVSQLTASATLLLSYNDCIAQSSGLVSTVKPHGDSIIFLKIVFKPPGSVSTAKIVSAPVITGGKFVSTEEAKLFAVGKLVTPSGITCQIKRDSKAASVAVTCTTTEGTVAEFAPGIFDVPDFPPAPPVDFVNLKKYIG